MSEPHVHRSLNPVPTVRDVQRSRIGLAAFALALAPTCLAFGWVSANAATGPTVSTHSTYAVRGVDLDVRLSGLSDGQTYTVATTGGDFETSGTSSVDVVGDSSGSTQLNLVRTSEVSATTSAVTLSLSQGASVVASDSVPFAAPQMTIANLCPARSAALTGFGLIVRELWP